MFCHKKSASCDVYTGHSDNGGNASLSIRMGCLAPILCITPAAILAQYVLAWRHIYLIYPRNINSCLVWLIFYLLGLLLGNNILKPSLSAGRLGIAYAAFLLLEIVEGFCWLAFGREDIASSQVKLSDMCLTLVVCLAAYRWLQKEKKPAGPAANVLIFLGNLSFTIYLVHPLVISLFKRLL